MNGSCYPFPKCEQLYLSSDDARIIILTLSPLIIITNLAVLLSSKLLLCSSKKPPVSIAEGSRKIALILLGNLALADIALATLCTVRVLYPDLHSKYIGCLVEKGATVSCSLTSMCCIVLIAVDRYFFIVHSIRYDVYMTESRARLLIYLSWVLGILFGSVPLVIESLYNKIDQGIKCRFVNPNNIVVMLVSGGFAFPLIVATFVLYMAIYWKARAVSKATMHKTGIQKLKTRSVIVVFLSSSCFLLTWGPYLISVMIYGSMCGIKIGRDRPEMCGTLEGLMASPFPMLGFLNSLLNPIIFAWWHRPFTRAVYEICCSGKVRKLAQARSIETTIATIT